MNMRKYNEYAHRRNQMFMWCSICILFTSTLIKAARRREKEARTHEHLREAVVAPPRHVRAGKPRAILNLLTTQEAALISSRCVSGGVWGLSSRVDAAETAKAVGGVWKRKVDASRGRVRLSYVAFFPRSPPPPRPH